MKKARVGRSGVSGKGVHAETSIKKGEAILRMSGERVREVDIDNRYEKGEFRWDDPFEIGGGEYVLLDPVPLAINHSCAPNVGIRGKGELFALRAIKKGEEIFYDYSTVVGRNAPGESDWLMRCKCGEPKCRKKIGNWLTLPPARLRFYTKAGALPKFALTQVMNKSGSSRRTK